MSEPSPRSQPSQPLRPSEPSDVSGAGVGGPILPGAEPFSSVGEHGVGALVLHGFTGSPHSVRGVAQALAAAGFAVELPLLPGHGTTMDDLIATRWDDWSSHVEAVYDDLAARTSGVVVVGLSMGGTLTAWLASRRPETLGIVLVNAALEPMAESFADILQGALDAGVDRIPGIGSDIADPDAVEVSYLGTPVAPLLSLARATVELAEKLVDIACPALVFTSLQDHVVPPSSGRYFAEQASGPVERVELARSYHVATLDYDREIVEAGTVAFARRVAGL